MKRNLFKGIGTVLIAISVYSLFFRILAGSDAALLPWPVALIVIAIGAFLVKQGGNVQGVDRERGKNPSVRARPHA